MISIADPDIDKEEKERVVEVLNSGMLADGPAVREFEHEFADFCDVDHAVATSSGTTALHTALETLDIGTGDTVVTSPFSFIATANTIRHVGANPVFADIDPETYNLDPQSVREVIEKRNGDIDAIIAVHLYGLPADMAQFRYIADQYDIPLIEDAAQAHGATVDGQRVGAIGDVGCFSFYPTKNMTTGEGGMVTTDDDDLRRRARQFVNHGQTDKYEHDTIGHNFRMTSIAAGLGLVQLEKLPGYNRARRENARLLTEGLAATALVCPDEPEDRRHVYHQYTIRTADRDGLADYLEQHDIGYGVYYPTPIHEQPAFAQTETDTPRSETAAEEVLSLPVHPGLAEDDIKKIIRVVRQYVGS